MSIEERDRLAELRDAFERRSSRRGMPTFRQLVQVYDGGAIPTTVPAMFLARPTGIGVDEVEGATPAITVDTSQTIPVLVLGPEVPVAGDNLVATVIGGRWVAGMQGGATPATCSPCSIPQHDLRLTVTAGVATSTDTAVYFPGPPERWQTLTAGTSYILSCTAIFTVLQIFDDTGGEADGAVVDFTCDPFHLVFHADFYPGYEFILDYP